jgi:hypothetical protein
MTFTPEFILQLVLAVGAAATTYGAIRSDLARLHERTNQALESAREAHQRIDENMRDRRKP